MRIAVIGPSINPDVTINGVQVFNRFLCDTLREMGHAVDYINQNQIYTPKGRIHLSPNIKLNLPAFRRPSYDQTIISGTDLNYRETFMHFRTKTLVWEHGPHVSPFRRWDGKEATYPGNGIVSTTDSLHAEALARNMRAVKINMPVQFQPRPVKEAADYAIAVGTLETRKQYEKVAAVAKALKIMTLVYGSELSPEVKQLVDDSPYLQYKGTLPHDELLGKMSEAMFLIHGAEIEARPTVTLEAMGMGVPVIVPDAPIYEEYIDPKKNILLKPNVLPKKRDITPLLKKENRQALADETNAKYGLDVFKQTLADLLLEGGV